MIRVSVSSVRPSGYVMPIFRVEFQPLVDAQAARELQDLLEKFAKTQEHRRS